MICVLFNLIGTREQAFVYALASSSLYYNIVKRCESNDGPLKCNCGEFLVKNNENNNNNNTLSSVSIYFFKMFKFSF